MRASSSIALMLVTRHWDSTAVWNYWGNIFGGTKMQEGDSSRSRSFLFVGACVTFTATRMCNGRNSRRLCILRLSVGYVGLRVF